MPSPSSQPTSFSCNNRVIINPKPYAYCWSVLRATIHLLLRPYEPEFVSTGYNNTEKLLDLSPSGMQVYSENLLCCFAMNSSGQWVSWIIEASVKPENLDSISSLMNEMSHDFMENERQTLNFEWSIDSTKTLLHLHERYEDSATALGHVKSFRSKYGDRFVSLISPLRVVVYGHPSEPLSKELQPLRPVVLNCLGGFTR